MSTDSVASIIKRIEKGECFSAMAPNRSFTLVIDEYVPYVCTAIHDGGNIRKEVRDKCALTKFERWQEEDPYTGDFISSFPIRLIVHDSRYEYDLNRAPDKCIYEEAWGKQVWKTPLSKEDIDLSKKKYDDYYQVLHAIVSKIEKKFDSCLVFDFHSYNYQRVERDTPVFNLGTKNIHSMFRDYLDEWLKNLSRISLPFVENITGENAVFDGNGYQLKYLSQTFKNTLVLATEIKKIYLDEESGDVYPEIIHALKEELKNAVTLQAKYFANMATSLTIKKRHGLLSSELTPLVTEIDSKIYRLMKDFDLLSYVSPSNIEAEKRAFFKSKFKKVPQFTYPPLQIDAPQLKRELYSLPVKNIKDVSLQNLYISIIDSYADQIDLLSCRGEEKFLYASLKYFGAPDSEELRISNFLTSAPILEVLNSDEKKIVHSDAVLDCCKQMANRFDFKGKITIAKNMVANAFFHSGDNHLKIKSDAKVSLRYAKALAHHEIGIHMLTTENAKLQPLKVLLLGLPVDTKTQEGLAVLSEYLSGTISMTRLKELALRVLAVNHMVKNYDFIETFKFLVSEYGMAEEHAFYMTARIYRGGGFTKDYLYLSGFKEIFQLYLDDKEKLERLLIGKTAIEHIPTISELISRDILKKPKHIPVSFLEKCNIREDILEYVISIFKNIKGTA